jgi:hypothetical protein
MASASGDLLPVTLAKLAKEPSVGTPSQAFGSSVRVRQ